MKVTYKYNLGAYQGKVDDMIFYVDKRSGRTLARRAFTFTNHSGQAPFRQAQQMIYAIKPSETYKQQLLDYCMSYNSLPEAEHKQLFTWCHVYNKIMWNMQKAMPESVDLKTITRQQIIAENLPCNSLKAAIDAGLLPKVKGYERFSAVI
ncbi:MAG: hypothetical protein RBS43_04430 [Candidatus Cloacimonas sp.]|jgi:hypothetical protein|nr:hypothetical protein [Candidatus Cloacimonas sp.]